MFCRRKLTLILIKNKLKFPLVILIFFLLNYLSYWYSIHFERILLETQRDRNYKVIQVLTNEPHGMALGESPFRVCPEKRCFAFRSISSGRPVENSDAVVVYASDLKKITWRSNYHRSRNQMWMLIAHESPQYAFSKLAAGDLKLLDNWFNLTATFKPDSDFVIGDRGFINWTSLPDYSEYLTSYKKKFHSKSKLNSSVKKSRMIWIAEDCSSEENAVNIELVSQLQAASLDIDVYGRGCEYMKNGRSDPCENSIGGEKCYLDLFQSYKFYLAFENSLCNYYVTKKLWRLYQPKFLFHLDILPVVRGASQAQYEQLMFTKKSFVHADGFYSNGALIHYLNYLNQNQTAYTDYFKWKLNLYDLFEKKLNVTTQRSYQVESILDIYGPFCLACYRLHDSAFMARNKKRSIKISEWFNPLYECWTEH